MDGKNLSSHCELQTMGRSWKEMLQFPGGRRKIFGRAPESVRPRLFHGSRAHRVRGRQAIAIGILVIMLCAITTFLAAVLNRELKRRNAAERKLTLLATTDGLAGLANGRHVNRALA
jgi:hypothetical protein